VVAASARMLGFLRHDMDILLKDGIEVDELAKDMIKFNPQRIHTLLAQKQLIPRQKRPGT
jgi:protein required for attachment to host cells